MKTTPITEAQAEQQGYRPLTHGYTSQEEWMMNNVIKDMTKGNIDFCVVEVGSKKEVWRKNSTI